MMCIFTGTPKPAVGGWNCPTIPTIAHRFTSVYMYVDQSNNLGGFAAGDMGDIATISGGTFVDHPVAPSAVTFHSVFVAQGGNNLEAWAVGSYNSAVGDAIYHFCCGPAGTWLPVNPSATTQDLQSVFLVSQNEGWAVGNQSVILHGTNLGPSGTNLWTSLGGDGTGDLLVGSGVGVDLLGVGFSGSSNGWAVGTKGVILTTQNSGCPGITVSSPLACWGGNTGITQTANLTTVFENSQSDTWVGGQWDFVNSQYSMLHWDGVKWHRATIQNIAGLFNITSIYMTGGGDGWAVGGSVDGTTPLAVHWNGNFWDGHYASQPVCTCYLTSVYMINSGEGWAVGSNGQFFHYTSSGGTNQWALVAPAWAAGIKWNSVFINSPGSSNANAGWAVGNGGNVAVLSISSGVANWNPYTIPALAGGKQNLYGVTFTDSNHGWIVGAMGTILTTVDDSTWSGGALQVTGGTATTTLRSVSVDMFGTGAGNGDGWAVGGTTEDRYAYNVMVHWDGLTWTSVTISPPPQPVSPSPCPSPGPYACGLAVNSVYVKGTQDGWAVGAGTFPAWPIGPAPLAGIFHLDPLEPPVSGGGGGATTIITTFTPAGGATTVATTVATTIAATTGKASSTVTNTFTAGTTVTGTSNVVTTASVVSTTLAVSTALIYNTLQMPGIPGFPWESIIAGIMIGLACIGLVRRLRGRSSA
jgi:photosystem II stability/assembly factor-like uncharacterized protein